MSEGLCDIYLYDADKVERVKVQQDLVDLNPVLIIYKALADKNRLKICFSLLLEDELCVCDLANILDASVATTSHHLRYLHQAKVLDFRKEGKNAFYRLKDEHIKTLIRTALAHGGETDD
ncbi:metalloregulator ArsR/SmtB family transcription factor [Macrococcus capreoli]|uniref:ArsR/SmtB family transcription factor n=1 Tax=Macrococcus capreoli TaxID=2982690 RepID=UPI0021D57A0F|nr:metalloregulator ArsR/SmtB family transcription factor [Macrococcus sp. TMW 2.2395]MCU7557869.1 metalloregulator ArsR/SmtB family transcription factor [Macrococcus sp. TMW 2.2395]